MCGRYTLELTLAELMAQWDIRNTPPEEALNAMLPHRDIAPTLQVPVVRSREGRRELLAMRWGLVPFFAHGVPGSYATHNARAESLLTTASYRGPWQQAQRCVIPASGYYEWQAVPNSRKKRRFLIRPRTQHPFGFAGLWEVSTNAAGQSLLSCTVITVGAGPLLSVVHPRMPVLLSGAAVETWLQGSKDAARALLQPCPDDLLQWEPINP